MPTDDTEKLMGWAVDEAMDLVQRSNAAARKARILQTAPGLVTFRDVFNVAGQIYAARLAAMLQREQTDRLIDALRNIANKCNTL